MNHQTKEFVGAWMQAIGTIMSAIGNTPTIKKTEISSMNLDLWGNVLQGTGNALIADSEEGVSLDKIGNKVQTVGNMVIVLAFLTPISEQVKTELNIKGNMIQAVGGSLSFADALNEEITVVTLYDIYGNLLQIIGNSMQSIGGRKSLKENDGETINTIGSWVQAIGSVLTLMSTIKAAENNQAVVN